MANPACRLATAEPADGGCRPGKVGQGQRREPFDAARFYNAAVSIKSTERSERGVRSTGVRIQPYLFLVLEGGRVQAGGMRIALSGIRSLRIGRGAAREFLRGEHSTLSVPDARMSTSHVCIARQDRGYLVQDEGSTNGTLVNGEAVTIRLLRDGDALEFGQTLFLYREIEEEHHIVACDKNATDVAALSGLTTLDPNLERQHERVVRMATSTLSMLLLGETGTGKEVVSREIHALSKRPGPFVAVNCGALPANLVESALFGHVRGAFSGAVRDEPGLVRAADSGTLLLDEVGDLPPSSQAALLRVLQEQEVLPVGGTRPVPIDVRVLAATHMPLDELIERGTFRRDLYARLAGYTFHLAPLRDRRVDLGLLIAALVASGKVAMPQALRVHREAARALVRHDWPLNIRELEQCLRAAILLVEDNVITIEHLPETVASALASESLLEDESPHKDVELRRELLVRMVDAKGNLSEVARTMGKARRQIQRWTHRFGIDPESFREH